MVSATVRYTCYVHSTIEGLQGKEAEAHRGK